MRTPTPLYRVLSSLIQARETCLERGNKEWEDRHEESILWLVENYLPSGSGIDCRTQIDLGASTPEKLVLPFSFHHMNDNGMYIGWTDYTAIVKASLQFGIDLRITGRDRRQIKDYLYECYDYAIRAKIWQDENCKWHNEEWEKVGHDHRCPHCKATL